MNDADTWLKQAITIRDIAKRATDACLVRACRRQMRSAALLWKASR